MKRALKTFGNVLGNCLNNKTYLRWAKKAPITNPPERKKSETVLEVPADVHRTRYNAIAAKATATPDRPAQKSKAAPPSQNATEGNAAFMKQAGFSLSKESDFSGDNNAGFSGVRSNETKSNVKKEEIFNETDPVKLERKRKQQMKKEEFCQQLKARKSDESIQGPGSIKSEEPAKSVSPIPEGFLFVI